MFLVDRGASTEYRAISVHSYETVFHQICCLLNHSGICRQEGRLDGISGKLKAIVRDGQLSLNPLEDGLSHGVTGLQS